MNERIRELVKQAVQLVADEHTNGDESRLNTDSYHVKDLIQEKFADLIVAECVSVIQEELDSGQYSQPVHTGFRVSKNLIKQHFGVEE